MKYYTCVFFVYLLQLSFLSEKTQAQSITFSDKRWQLDKVYVDSLEFDLKRIPHRYVLYRADHSMEITDTLGRVSIMQYIFNPAQSVIEVFKDGTYERGYKKIAETLTSLILQFETQIEGLENKVQFELRYKYQQ